MNSEELELSLRSEFENYLKGVISELRQETAEFQAKIQSEFDKQKTSFDEAFAAFAGRFESERGFDQAFIGSVSEHLRLARDEGAKITAEAFAEAEKLEKESAPPAVAKYDAIRDAVNDISSKDSQATILKSLVEHAAQFAPRGAFFIIKSEHFTGWKVFGADTGAAESVIRDLSFSTAKDTILSASTRALATVKSPAGAHSEDSAFTESLGFGHPERMYAIPLVARGKAVAVLYADSGNDAAPLQTEALETLVRVAGLTVELIASHPARHDAAPAASVDFSDAHHTAEPAPWTAEQPTQFVEPVPSVEPARPTSDFAFTDRTPFGGGFTSFEPEPVEEKLYEPVHEVVAEPETEHFYEPVASFEEVSAVEEAVTEAEFETVPETEFETVSGFEATPSDFEKEYAVEAEPEVSYEPEIEHDAVADFAPSTSPFETAAEDFSPVTSNGGFEPAPEPAVEAAAPAAVPTGSRLRDRNVDLPIDVPEEERRSHNDARRFARLLVSEIKLYNEKKVIEGREASDLYSRLREAIDRSREMYDKRVQPPVASKFDYFHYELVNSLAEGDAGRLGSGYPGASV